MFRKSALPLLHFSKSIASQSYKGIAALTSKLPFSTEVYRSILASSDETVHRAKCDVLINKIAERSVEVQRIQSEVSALQKAIKSLAEENERDNSELELTRLYTTKKAEEVIQNIAEIEAPFFNTLSLALERKKTYGEFSFCGTYSGHYLNVLKTVLKKYEISLSVNYGYHYRAGDYTDFSIWLPADFESVLEKNAGNIFAEHPVYARWLEKFIPKLENILRSTVDMEYKDLPRPML